MTTEHDSLAICLLAVEHGYKPSSWAAQQWAWLLKSDGLMAFVLAPSSGPFLPLPLSPQSTRRAMVGR